MAAKRKEYQNHNGSNKKHKTEETATLSSSAQKRQVKKDRQSHRRHAENVTEAKTLWNKLRMKSNTPEENKELMLQVMKLIQGKVNEISLQHDASRVVQAAVQFGNDEQRMEILTEICETPGALAELSKIQYAHFLALKLIKYCVRNEKCVKMIVKSFKGSIPKLAVHAVGARVVESLFLNLSSKETASLKQEFYGPHFSLFVRNISGVPTLKSNLESATTDKQRESATNFVKDLITKGITKSFFGYTFFQELLGEYIDTADPSDIRELAPSIADHSIHLLSTRSGARIVAEIASYGTPKDRKRICKSIKGYTKSSLLHRDAYLALIRLIQVTDDTVSINKSILNEILTAPKEDENESDESSLLDLALSDTASKFFLFLLTQDQASKMKYFDPYERSILESEPLVKGIKTFKKDSETRRQELLKYMQEGLVDLCLNHADSLVLSVPGSRVLKEVYSSLASEDLVDGILNLCQASLKKDEEVTIFEDPTGHLAVKNLILSDVEREIPLFSAKFLDRLGENLMDVAKSNRGAFVVSSLFKVPSLKQKVSKILMLQRADIKKLSNQKGANAGYKALLKEIS